MQGLCLLSPRSMSASTRQRAVDAVVSSMPRARCLGMRARALGTACRFGIRWSDLRRSSGACQGPGALSKRRICP
jgi:hypothetical protein